MSPYESDAHGRIHRSVEISVDDKDIARATRDEKPGDDEELILMSDGNKIRREDVLHYMDSFPDTDEDDERQRKIDAVVISSVAGLGAIALGLALHRLKKKQ
jgi:hypothetical protein